MAPPAPLFLSFDAPSAAKAAEVCAEKNEPKSSSACPNVSSFKSGTLLSFIFEASWPKSLFHWAENREGESSDSSVW